MVRLQLAKYLLKWSDRLIIAPAVESGVDSSHLIGAFGESLGMTLRSIEVETDGLIALVAGHRHPPVAFPHSPGRM